MIARKYTDVGRQLPPLVEQVVTFNLPPTLQTHYATLRNKWRLGKQPLESAGAVTVLLRQITMCPAKIAAVGSILEDVPPHEPVMLYTWYKESATLLYEAFGSTARTLLLTGDTDANERAKLLAQASTNGVKYIIATQGALSEGANLQWIRYVVYAEEQYVAEAHRQTLARFQRDRGDEAHTDNTAQAPVIAYYVRARRTIDETVARARLRGAASIADVARSLLTDDD
jgi:superfamily II DNA or RNA helicase